MNLRTLVLSALALVQPLLGGEPIIFGELTKLPSKVLKEERTLIISTPPNYARGKEAFPVLYLTDGPDHILHTRGSVDFLVRNNLMPDVIIVGIANTDRTRDLTPTPGYTIDGDGVRWPIKGSGGGTAFVAFLEQELFPFIEATYRTVPCRLFAGHSLGGLMALHFLAAKPNLFNGLIAASPALAWDDDYPLRKVADALRDQKSLARSLFVTMANEEAGQSKPTHFDRLKQTLARNKTAGFSWDARHIPQETHASTVLLAYYSGLRKLFEGWNLPFNPLTGQYEGSAKDLRIHFERVSQRLGCSLLPPEGPVNFVGYQVMARKAYPEAIAILRLNAENHPGSPNVHDSLGEALERAGQDVEALKSYQKAVELGQPGNHPSLPVFHRNLNRITARLKRP